MTRTGQGGQRGPGSPEPRGVFETGQVHEFQPSQGGKPVEQTGELDVDVVDVHRAQASQPALSFVVESHRAVLDGKAGERVRAQRRIDVTQARALLGDHCLQPGAGREKVERFDLVVRAYGEAGDGPDAGQDGERVAGRSADVAADRAEVGDVRSSGSSRCCRCGCSSPSATARCRPASRCCRWRSAASWRAARASRSPKSSPRRRSSGSVSSWKRSRWPGWAWSPRRPRRRGGRSRSHCSSTASGAVIAPLAGNPGTAAVADAARDAMANGIAIGILRRGRPARPRGAGHAVDPGGPARACGRARRSGGAADPLRSAIGSGSGGR